LSHPRENKGLGARLLEELNPEGIKLVGLELGGEGVGCRRLKNQDRVDEKERERERKRSKKPKLLRFEQSIQ